MYNRSRILDRLRLRFTHKNAAAAGGGGRKNPEKKGLIKLEAPAASRFNAI